MIDTRTERNHPGRRALIIVGIFATALCLVAPTLAAETLQDFSQALRTRGVSQDEVTAIIDAFDAETWEAVPSGIDMDALALSLAYALEAGIAPRESTEIVAVTQSAATEIARARELGFSRQEAARAGVRHTRNTVAELSSGAGQPEAQQPAQGRAGELPPTATEAMRRGLNRARQYGPDMRSRTPGVPPRNPPPTPFSPGGETPDTDGADRPGTPGTPGTPTGPE